MLVWAMVYPMTVTVDFSSLARVHDRPEWLIITLADRSPIALATAD